ncbi:MAG: hypothetical protein KY466_08190 [Gemmatimonadetes bacterium]|nr:hypothetical protein [Gemmatimonadota bacterium]
MRAGATRGALAGGGIILAGFALIALLVLVLGNGTTDPVAEQSERLVCHVLTGGAALPNVAGESSGLARGVRDPALFWTHNDSGDDPVLYAIAEGGRLAGSVAVEGAEARDWEDIESAPCPGTGEPCLYISDTGDNAAERDRVAVYVAPEPDAGAGSVTASAIHLRYPEGPRDAEGLFLVDGRIHLVTKGREGPIRLYRVPEGVTPGATATLEAVADISPRPGTSADYVTAATATPDGRWIAMRTYRELLVLEAAPLLAGAPGPARRYDLAPLAEVQGEGLVMDDEGGVWLTSEGGRGAPPAWSRLVCEL